MSDMTTPRTLPPLGIGGLLGDAFTAFQRNAVPLTIIAAIPAAVSVAMNFALYGSNSLDPGLAFTDPGAAAAMSAQTSGLVQFLATVVGMLLMSLSAGALVHATAEAQAGRRISVGASFGAALGQTVPLFLCILIAIFACSIAMIALIVPALYLAALWSMIVPAIMLERAGFGAFGRSARLSREYRWPLVGLWVLFFVIVTALLVLGGAVQSVLASLGGVFLATSALVAIVFAALYSALGGVLTTRVWYRLIEIKEGGSALAEVFD